jgi:adenosine deaminase
VKINKTTEQFINSMPKIELHLHLEGAIPLDTLWELIKKYTKTDEVSSPETLAAKFTYSDFDHFIETWYWKNQFLREYDDFTLIAEAVATDLISQNIRYAETFFSPADVLRMNLQPQYVAEAIHKGLCKYSDSITINLIVDLVRDFGSDNGLLILHQMSECREFDIIGIGIGGTEQKFPPELFIDTYKEARRLDFHTTAHAGEAAGCESIWGALNDLQSERIGHGTRAKEDPELLQYLVDNQIPLEMCPISNIKTGVVKSMSDHPIIDYMNMGILVSVNTDDPKMFNTSMESEYLELINTFQLSKEDIKLLQTNAVKSIWADAKTKMQLNDDILSYFNSQDFS